jgi:uncharacterized protein (TIGR00297 family)
MLSPQMLPVALVPFAERFARALVVNGALFVGALRRGQTVLTARGLRHAFALGLLLWTADGLRAYALCFGFLVVGSAATRIGRAEKEARGIAEKRGGARGPENVWAAAGVAAVCAAVGAAARLALAATWAPAWIAIVPRVARVAYVTSLATKTSDTLASEIGKAYGKRTYLVTTLRPVPRGTEGAVSLEGTVAGTIGSLAAAGYGLATGLLDGLVPIGVVVVSAFVATTAESVIGAAIQEQRGWSNEFVNLLNTAIGAGTAVALVLGLGCCGV